MRDAAPGAKRDHGSTATSARRTALACFVAGAVAGAILTSSFSASWTSGSRGERLLHGQPAHDPNRAPNACGDGTPESEPTATSSAGSSDNSQGECTVEIITMDNRPVEWPAGSRGGDVGYWTKALALNKFYSRRHDIRMRFFSPVQPRGAGRGESLLKDRFAPPWCKFPLMVNLLKQRVRRQRDRGDGTVPGSRCHWFFFVDSDAAVRELNVHPADFLRRLERKHLPPDPRGQEEMSFVVAREDNVPPMGNSNTGVQPINTGIFFVKANEWSLDLFTKLLADARGRCARWRRDIFWEQSCMYGALGLADGLPAPAPGRVRVLPMQQMNSPWGQLVMHIWTGAGGEKRDTDFDKLFETFGLWSREDRVRLAEEINASRMTFAC